MPLTFYLNFALNLSAGRKSGGEADPKKGSRVNKQTVQSFLNSIPRQLFTSGRTQLPAARLNKDWRRGRDSNPRYPLRYVRFRGGSFQPLTHLSGSGYAVVSTQHSAKWIT